MTKKFFLIIVILVIILFAAIYFLILTKEEEESPLETPKTGEQEIIPPAATGNINDVVDALIKELSDEDLVLEQEDNDINLITSDSQEISDFGQSANENEL